MTLNIELTSENLDFYKNGNQTFKSGQGKGMHMKNVKPYVDFVLKFLVRHAELINGDLLLPINGKPVIVVVSHGPGYAWVPLMALAGKHYIDSGCGDIIGGMIPHKAMFLIPGLKSYYEKVLGAPTHVTTVDDVTTLLKNKEIGMTGTAPEGVNCLFSFDEYVAPFRSKGLIAAAIKANANICLVAHQGAEAWKKTINLPFGWTVPFTNGLKGIHMVLPPFKKIDQYIAMCRPYEPSITADEFEAASKREARLLLNIESERIRSQLILMTDEVKTKIKGREKRSNLEVHHNRNSNWIEKKGKSKPVWSQKIIHNRADKWSVSDPNPKTMEKQMTYAWNFLLNHYFRSEVTGWEKLPAQPSMLIGIHSGTWLTMDAWTFCAEWWRKYQGSRVLHGTSHDVLMALPGLGQYFRNVGVIPANRKSVSAAFTAGHDVILWPGGETDAMRSWSRRNEVDFAGRKGFVRQAIRSGVPIVPVATVGGHDTVFVLSEGRALAKALNLKKWLRSESAPLVLGFPLGISLEVMPMHIPMPAKIRTEILEPICLDNDPERENDDAYVNQKYEEVKASVQNGVNRLAKLRKFPFFG